MKIHEISNIQRIENNIHYIRRYSATLEYSLLEDQKRSSDILFSIEHDAMGQASVVVDFKVAIDYPLIPARKRVTEYIKNYDSQGLLR